MCRMDDLAVDSDEEVDYSKMDQVSIFISNVIIFYYLNIWMYFTNFSLFFNKFKRNC